MCCSLDLHTWALWHITVFESEQYSKLTLVFLNRRPPPWFWSQLRCSWLGWPPSTCNSGFQTHKNFHQFLQHVRAFLIPTPAYMLFRLKHSESLFRLGQLYLSFKSLLKGHFFGKILVAPKIRLDPPNIEADDGGMQVHRGSGPL